MTEILSLPMTVKVVEERYRTVSGHKDHDGHAVLDERSTGWWVVFEGSNVAINVGEKPDLSPGDNVKLMIVKRGKPEQ